MVVGALMERYPTCTDFKGEDSGNKAGEVGRWQTMTDGFGSAVHSWYNQLWAGKSLGLFVWNVVLSRSPIWSRKLMEDPAVSNLLASLGHTGRRTVFLGYPVNIQMLMKTTTKKSHKVLSKFTILCWAAFIAMLGCTQPAGCGLSSPGQGPLFEGQAAVLGLKVILFLRK